MTARAPTTPMTPKTAPAPTTPTPTPMTAPAPTRTPTAHRRPTPTSTTTTTVATEGDPRVNHHHEVNAQPPLRAESQTHSEPHAPAHDAALQQRRERTAWQPRRDHARDRQATIRRARARRAPGTTRSRRRARADRARRGARGRATTAPPPRASTARSSICSRAAPTCAGSPASASSASARPARTLAVDTYRRAVAERPDHLTGHRLLAYALLRDGKHAEAFAAILAGSISKYPDDRFAGGDRVLREDAGMIGAAYARGDAGEARRDRRQRSRKREPRAADAAARRASSCTGRPTPTTSTSTSRTRAAVTLFYGSKPLPSGGELYADVTTGYGPECFAIGGTPTGRSVPARRSTTTRRARWATAWACSRSSASTAASFAFEDRPYVIMKDQAYVSLGAMR